MAVLIKKLSGPAPYPGMLSAPQCARLQGEVIAVVTETVERRLDFAPAGATERARAAVPAFFALFDERVVRDNEGGSGFNDSLWLYVLARVFAPRAIVESGVHKGHGTWVMRQACPLAAIHCFDIDLSKLLYRDEMAQYFDRDWMKVGLDVPRDAPRLAFFDDHISHARRLREAKARGFELLLFDDNFPAHNLYATGGPPVPTLAMIMDETLEAEDDIVWTRNAKSYSYRCNAEELSAARGLIERYEVLPELSPITRYSPGSGLTVVKLGE